MLDLDRIGHTYGIGPRVLSGITLRIAPGEIIAVIGSSGCGKSTLLRFIAGLDVPSEGRVALDGETITKPHPRIGIIFQEPRLMPWLTVEGNVAFGLVGHMPTAERQTRVAAAIARVGLTAFSRAWPRQLSGGQAQRVAIARALVCDPEVLLMDEPFGALDHFTRAGLQDHLVALWTDRRPTLVIVTHDAEEAAVLADRVVVMRPRPGEIEDIVRVPLPRPRDRLSPEVEAIKHHLLELLTNTFKDAGATVGSGVAEARDAALWPQI
jgi:sulfonate transport system ATP-binding protein